MKTIHITIFTLVILFFIGWGLTTVITNKESEVVTQQTPMYLTEVISGDAYIFTTKEGLSGVVSYSQDNPDMVIVGFDERFYELQLVPSISGTRYTNEDEEVLFFEDQEKAQLSIKDTVYEIPILIKTNIEVFEVASEPVTCTESASAGICLQVNGRVFNNEIEGFDYQPGNAYQLIIAKTQVPHPPVGYAPYRYQLLEVLSVDSDLPAEDTIHPSWDINENGINDCEEEGICDHTVDYTQPRPSISPLETYSWVWEQTEYEDGRVVSPDSDEFIATFLPTGDFNSQTDCNGIFGSYETSETTLSFHTLGATKMACEGEVYEAEYTQMLSRVVSYQMEVDTELVLKMSNGGSIIFTPHQKVIDAE